MSTLDEKFLEFSHLSMSFPKADGTSTKVVDDFQLTVAKGEFVCLIGHSGCGKSTVLSVLAGLINASEGGAILQGREVREPGIDRGIVFQQPNLLPWLSAFGNVMMAVNAAFPQLSRKERADKATHFLTLVGLEDAMEKKSGELSAGMRQRVGIARAFALDPKVLLLDEPFGMLDSLTRFELQQVLLDLWATDRKTAFMVTHDVDEALFLSDRVVMMTSGPHAKVGKIVKVPFSRPRDRATLMEHPQYYDYRDTLIEFLNSQEHDKGQNKAA
ncbi:MAG: ABC transporter ATP-binding protein [Deltaproteobacteria bacterium]|nr:ABC transporter ATP-binding protein [Deltaproteobacteria bacterium]